MGALYGFFIIYMIIVFALVVFLIIAQWKMYEKAGQPGWACIIPIYNTLVLLKIVKKEWWWIFLFMIPFVNIVIAIIVYVELAKVFGKPGSFALGLIFLPFVFIPVLAFGEAKYIEG